MKTIISSLLVGILVLALEGCTPRVTHPISMFTNDMPYHTDPQDPNVLIYRNPNLKVSSYSKFLIDPVKIYSNESHNMKAQDQSQLAEKFRGELTKILKGYTLVEKPGPGVLRVRTAIQDIQPAHVELDEDKFLVLRLDTLLSHVAMELECVDALTNEPVVALIHTLQDRKYFEKEQTTRLLNIREAFGIWTQSLRERLDAARFRPKPGFEGPENDEHRRLQFEEGE